MQGISASAPPEAAARLPGSSMLNSAWIGLPVSHPDRRKGPTENTVVDVFLADLARNAQCVVDTAMRYWSLQDASERLMRVAGFADFMAKEACKGIPSPPCAGVLTQ
jgi:hypothetical protein